MTARDRFEAARKAVVEFNQIQTLKWLEGDEWKPEGAKGAGIAKPTETRAIYLADVWSGKLKTLERREKELLELIGDTLRLIEEVREHVGDIHASLLDQRYIDGLTWKETEYQGKRVPKSTGKAKIAQAFAWIDEQ